MWIRAQPAETKLMSAEIASGDFGLSKKGGAAWSRAGTV
jgi:hypothetical protein